VGRASRNKQEKPASIKPLSHKRKSWKRGSAQKEEGPKTAEGLFTGIANKSRSTAFEGRVAEAVSRQGEKKNQPKQKACCFLGFMMGIEKKKGEISGTIGAERSRLIIPQNAGLERSRPGQ